MFCLLDLALALALTPQRVLVIGANGQTGSRVVRLLRDAPEFEPVAMLRLPEQQETFNAMGVEHVLGDMDAGAPTAQHMANIDAVIYADGTRKVDEHLLERPAHTPSASCVYDSVDIGHVLRRRSASVHVKHHGLHSHCVERLLLLG